MRIASASSVEIDFRYLGVRCRERIKVTPTVQNLKRVALHRAAVLNAIANGTFDYAATFPESPNLRKFVSTSKTAVTFASFAKDTYLKRAKEHLKSSTFIGYQRAINQFCAAFGDRPIEQITVKEVKLWADQQDCGPKRMRNLASVLRVVLDEAVEDELIAHNPLHDWAPKRKDHAPKVSKVDPFSADEQSRILDALTGQAKNLIQFAFWTGLRTSELIALEWGDIDLKKAQASITKAVTQSSDEPEDTKTAAGRRVIVLLPPAIEALKAQREFSLLHSSGVIFLNPRTGKPWEGDAPIRKTLWVPALKRSGVRYRRPYQTRHTFASMMLSAGENIAWVAKMMGHGDLSMVSRVYGKWVHDTDPQAGSKAVGIFWANENADQKTDHQVSKQV